MNKIDINTTQNVTIEYALASLIQRIAAFFIDAIILIVFTYFWLLLVGVLIGDNSEDYFLKSFLYNFAPLLFSFFYFLLLEGTRGQTLGKRVLGIKVIRIDGQEPFLSDYALRAVFHVVDTLFCFGMIATIFVLVTEKKQRLGDFAANTCVVSINPAFKFNLIDILRIESRDNYEPVYPQITMIAESDIILLKNVVDRYKKMQNEAHSAAVIDMAYKMESLLGIENPPVDKLFFLNTLLKDYIVLTR